MNAILITGATGNVGRPLVEQLADAGVEVRAVTRHPAAAEFPADVKVVGSAAAGLPGASAIFLNSRALGEELGAVVDLAVRQGVTRLVALSAINADDDFSRQPSRFRGDRNKEVEQLAVGSGVEWVSLRPDRFRVQLRRHVVGADQGRRRGQRPVRRRVDRARSPKRISPRWPRMRCLPMSW